MLFFCSAVGFRSSFSILHCFYSVLVSLDFSCFLTGFILEFQNFLRPLTSSIVFIPFWLVWALVVLSRVSLFFSLVPTWFSGLVRLDLFYPAGPLGVVLLCF